MVLFKDFIVCRIIGSFSGNFWFVIEVMKCSWFVMFFFVVILLESEVVISEVLVKLRLIMLVVSGWLLFIVR